MISSRVCFLQKNPILMKSIISPFWPHGQAGTSFPGPGSEVAQAGLLVAQDKAQQAQVTAGHARPVSAAPFQDRALALFSQV